MYLCPFVLQSLVFFFFVIVPWYNSLIFGNQIKAVVYLKVLYICVVFRQSSSHFTIVCHNKVSKTCKGKAKWVCYMTWSLQNKKKGISDSFLGCPTTKHVCLSVANLTNFSSLFVRAPD